MKKIAILGAGVMGSGIALNLASFGYRVILKDIEQHILTDSQSKISDNFRMLQMMKSEFRDLTIEEVLENISFQTDYEGFDQIDMVIENVSEDWDVKSAVYKELTNVCRDETLYGVNTSCISITQVASLVPVPAKVIGMHFMNPAPLKEMVELVRGYHTTEETIEKTKEFLKSIKKTSVVAEDMPGFIANRLSHLFMNEAAFLVQDNVGKPRDIDMLFRKGYGHAMGPLETADLIGLDTVVDSLEVLYKNYQDSKFRCCPLLKKMVAAGLTGKKSGEGFYKYG